MQVKLTNENIKKLRPEDKPYEVLDTEVSGLLLRVQPTGRMTYYFSYRTADGKRQRYRIGRHGNVTPAIARDRAKELAGEVAKGDNPHQVAKIVRAAADRAKAETFSGFIDNHYRDYCETSQKSGKATINRLLSSFPDFTSLRLVEITELRITKWRNDRLKAGNKATTLNRTLTALKAMLNKAVTWGVIDASPLTRFKRMKEDNNSVIRYLSAPETERLYKALDARELAMRERRSQFNQWRIERGKPVLPERTDAFADYLKPMVALALNTGMRRGELFSLEWQDVCLTQKTITVHGENAKSQTTRIIPLNNEAVSVITKWRNQSNSNQTGLVFPSPKSVDDGVPQRFDNINKSWRGIQKEAGLLDFRFHDLRHTFASKLVMKGVDLNTVRELLGHSDIQMTMRYAHLAPEHKAAAVAMLNS